VRSPACGRRGGAPSCLGVGGRGWGVKGEGLRVKASRFSWGSPGDLMIHLGQARVRHK